MAQTNKLKAAFCACTGSFSFREFERLLRSLGYAEVKTGRSGGSRRRYFNEETKHIVMLHEPHDGQMGKGMVERLRDDLKAGGKL